MNTTTPSSRLDAATEAERVVLGQFDQVATLIREIAKIEALAQQEGISDVLKEILHQEAQAAYERLKTIRAWTDGEISQLLSKTSALAGSQAGTTEDVDFDALIPHEWELISLSTRLGIQSGTASMEQIADAKAAIRAFRRKVATFGKPYAEFTERERLQLRFVRDPKKGN